ncbi:MAG: hypothetical protein LH613_19285 [Chamaesiphon sp.]|nr:hypothetical protein [Chamaesiphon sp.]
MITSGALFDLILEVAQVDLSIIVGINADAISTICSKDLISLVHEW